MALEAELRGRGRALHAAGLRPELLAVDLDETIWEWSATILRQPLLAFEHTEMIYVRQPLLWLLQGLCKPGDGPIKAWTSGYGYRLDEVCRKDRKLDGLLQLNGRPSQSLPTVFTRMDLARAFAAQPQLIPEDTHRISSQKLPGTPTAAGKPPIDAARILLDDKERNCRRYVGAGEGRSAIWLRGSPRKTKQVLPLIRHPEPLPRLWANGVSDALAEIAAGRVGLYPVDPEPSLHKVSAVRVRLPHHIMWREWGEPTRAIGQQLRARADSP